MSWVKAEFWLGAPMKGFRVNPRHFRRDTDVLMDFYSHPAQYASLVTFLFEQVGVVPEGSTLIGAQTEWQHTDVILVFLHKTFPRVDEGTKYPVEDAVIDADRWDAAMVILRAAKDRMQQLTEAGTFAIQGVA